MERRRARARSATAGLERARTLARLSAVALYLPMGLLHVSAPDRFLPIMPPFVPFPRDVVVATGVAEILGAVGLLWPRSRQAAAIGLALYAVGVYPANVYHAVAHRHVPPLPDSWWYHAPRLAFQPTLVWWALFAGGLIHRGDDKRLEKREIKQHATSEEID